MARIEDLMAKPSTWSVPNSAVNGAVTATQAGVVNNTHFITGVSVSCSAQPTGSAQVQILDGAVVLDQWEVPAAAFSPIIVQFSRPFRCTRDSAASVTMGALGAAVRGTVTIRGFTEKPAT